MLSVELSNIPLWCLMGLRFVVIQRELQQKQLFINEIQFKKLASYFQNKDENLLDNWLCILQVMRNSGPMPMVCL